LFRDAHATADFVRRGLQLIALADAEHRPERPFRRASLADPRKQSSEQCFQVYTAITEAIRSWLVLIEKNNQRYWRKSRVRWTFFDLKMPRLSHAARGLFESGRVLGRVLDPR
jgi:hypothetical protein